MLKIPIYCRYIFITLGKYFLFAECALTLIMWLIHINNIMNIALQSSGLYVDILMLCLYIIPYIMSIVMPLALFAAISMTLYQFRKNNIVLSLYSLGIKPMQIYIPMYYLGCMIVLLHYMISFLILPVAFKHFKETQIHLKQEQISNMIEAKTIKTNIPGLEIYIDSKYGNLLKHIFISDTRNKQVSRVFTAKEGEIKITSSSIELYLYQGTYQQIDLDHNSTFMNFASYSVSLPIKQNFTTLNRVNDPNEMSFKEMLTFLDKTGLRFNKVKSIMHQKIIWPIYSILFIFICIKLEWLYYYKDYIRDRKTKTLWYMLLFVLILASAHFIAQGISTNNIKLGILIMYLHPILLTQIMFQILKFKNTIKNG